MVILKYALLVALMVVSIAVFAEARYQAIPLDSGYEFGSEKAFLLDTVAGHMWIWVESPAVGARNGGRYLIYQGQLEPGREVGDVILRQEWTAEEPP